MSLWTKNKRGRGMGLQNGGRIVTRKMGRVNV